VKNSCQFLFIDFLDPVFSHFRPIISTPRAKTRFMNGLFNILFLIYFKFLPSTLTFAKKQIFLTYPISRENEIIEGETKLIL